MNKVMMVRYKVKPDRAEENESLVRRVYAELRDAAPAGLRYATFVHEDGVSFVHVASSEGDRSPLNDVAAFQDFQRNIDERCDEPPAPARLREVGSYGFWSE